MENITLTNDILDNTVFDSQTIRIPKVIHVRKGAILTLINCQVLILPGDTTIRDLTPLPSLVIDSGASIIANNTRFESLTKLPDRTGGLFILGTLDNEFPDRKSVV